MGSEGGLPSLPWNSVPASKARAVARGVRETDRVRRSCSSSGKTSSDDGKSPVKKGGRYEEIVDVLSSACHTECSV
jgi:hypothetical protein